MASIHEFMEIRELILKNAIYEKLLIGTLSKENDFYVSSVLKPLLPETRSLISSKKLPNYVQYDIIVRFCKSEICIGLKYKDHPIIFQYTPTPIKNLHKLAEFIYSNYSINPAKLDKIFSNISEELKDFFQINSYSSNFWRLGYSKKIAKKEIVTVDNEKTDEYLRILTARNNQYRTFNKILISLQKRGSYYFEDSEFGSLSVRGTIFNKKMVVTFESYLDCKVYSDIFPIHTFTPILWSTVDSEIDVYVLEKLS